MRDHGLRVLRTLVVSAVGVLLSAQSPGAAVRASAPTPLLGTNLSGPADYNTELPFVDVFRMARPWISQQKGRPWEGGGMYYARRSVQIFRIWEEVFGGQERLVRVIAWQSGNTYWMRKIVLPFEDTWKHTDALAIAPYISCNVPPKGKELSAPVVAKWSVEQALDYMEKESLPRSIRAIRASKEVADDFGLKLLAYEGGQHMVGVGGGENNETMTGLFHAANAHPRMGRIYSAYLDAWKEAGGDLFCNFSSIGRWSKWGSWGVMQYYDDDPAQSYKFMAIMRWAKACGQAVNVPN